jgi:hypothetical protein
VTDGPGPRTIRLVLDTSAVTGFVRGSIAVGEMIAMTDSEEGAVLVPLPCLVQAAADTMDGGPWLTILTNHPAVQVITDEFDDWPMLAGIRQRIGAYEPAAAAWLALRCEVDVMTRYPEIYEPLGDIGITLPFED